MAALERLHILVWSPLARRRAHPRLIGPRVNGFVTHAWRVWGRALLRRSSAAPFFIWAAALRAISIHGRPWRCRTGGSSPNPLSAIGKRGSHLLAPVGNPQEAVGIPIRIHGVTCDHPR